MLIVDDERSIRNTLRAFLQEAGHDVETADDVRSAMQLLKSGDFNVVVSDIDMPKVSGFELLRSIRAVSPRMSVILMTATPTDESDAASATSGVTTCLIKPFSKEAILQAVADAAQANTPSK